MSDETNYPLTPKGEAAMLLMIHEVPAHLFAAERSEMPLNAYSLIRLAQESAASTSLRNRRRDLLSLAALALLSVVAIDKRLDDPDEVVEP